MVSQTTETESGEMCVVALESRRPALTIAHHPDWSLVGLRVTVGERGALLGRSDAACLPGAFEVGKVSREHARVSAVEGALTITDLD